MPNDNRQLAVFRVKADLALETYAKRLKVFVAENLAMGMTKEAVKGLVSDPDSRWAMEREKLIKDIKREVAGLINRVHIAAYTGRAL